MSIIFCPSTSSIGGTPSLLASLRASAVLVSTLGQRRLWSLVFRFGVVFLLLPLLGKDSYPLQKNASRFFCRQVSSTTFISQTPDAPLGGVQQSLTGKVKTRPGYLVGKTWSPGFHEFRLYVLREFQVFRNLIHDLAR